MEACFPPPRQRMYHSSPHSDGNSSPHPGNPLVVLQGNCSRQRNCAGEGSPVPCWKTWMRKYIILCLLCGGLSVLLGIVFIIIYFILRSYTSSLQFFETIPTYVPAIVLIITGLVVMCFAKRRNRYTYLIKLAGGCCLVCALLCVVITVTTTVVHMNRLQMLHECIYTPKAKTCMCVSAISDTNTQEGAHRFIFNNTPNCEVVHGSLFACLRTLFGLSVIGILVCIFSSMLVYQLLTHEKKKTYWEQLELRRRFLYCRYPNNQRCGCCDDFYPWPLWDVLDYRLLNMPQQPLTPNGEAELSPTSTVDLSSSNGFGGGGHLESNSSNRGSWNWLPWRRSNNHAALRDNNGWMMNPSPLPPQSPQSEETEFATRHRSQWRNDCLHLFRNNNRNAGAGGGGGPIRFGIRPRHNPWHRRTRSNDGVFHHLHQNRACPPGGGGGEFAGYELPRYMWGPPPPYSQPPSMEDIPQLVERCHDLESSTSTPSGKSTPLLLRHTSDSIRLTISGHFTDMQNWVSVTGSIDRRDNCVVQVHVPSCLITGGNGGKDIFFNTLPTRSSRKRDHFKSLSNIPLSFSRRFNSLNERLSVIECFPPFSTISEKYEENISTNTEEYEAAGESSTGFHTIVELPSDFKSSIVIATSPSTPVTENVTLSEMIYAQSMPNLSLPATTTPSISRKVLHRAPSSGNTSTSQDLADFELEEDSSPIVVMRDDDVLSVASLPDDNDSLCYITEVPIEFREDPPPPKPPLRWESYGNTSTSCANNNCDSKLIRTKRRECDSEDDGCPSTRSGSEEGTDVQAAAKKTDFVITFKSINV